MTMKTPMQELIEELIMKRKQSETSATLAVLDAVIYRIKNGGFIEKEKQEIKDAYECGFYHGHELGFNCVDNGYSFFEFGHLNVVESEEFYCKKYGN